MSSSPSPQPFPDSTAPRYPQEVPEAVAAHTDPEASKGPEPKVLHEQKKPTSPTWYGGILVGSIALMAAILLTYTLLDWEWQQNLGWWNYVAAVLLIPFATVFMLTWQPDETL
jgi:hypothetical protein